MDTRRQSRRRLAPGFSFSFTTLFLALLLQTTAVRAAFTNNFDAYPASSRSCLYASANTSGCDGDDVTAMNDCLCGNTGNFVISAAECIGKSDYDDLETVYTTMASACSYSNTPLAVSQKDFLSAGNGTYSSSTTSSTTSTSTSMPSTTSGTSSTPSLTTITTTSNGHVETTTSTAGSPKNTGGSSSDNKDSGMSSTTKTGIIAGATVAGVAIVAVFAFFLIRMWRSRQPTEEHRPMLGGGDGFNDTGAGGGRGGGGGSGSQMGSTELARLSAAGTSTYDWKAGAVGGDPGEHKWPHDPYNTTPSPSLLYQQQSGGVFELPVQEGVQHPVEMPATPMVRGATPAYHHPQGQPVEYSSAYR